MSGPSVLIVDDERTLARAVRTFLAESGYEAEVAGDAETALGEVFMRSLLREQLFLALRVLAALGVTLGLLPLLFHLVPSLGDVRVGQMPLAWLLLGVLAYPWLVVLGWFYIRQSEANERDFADLVGSVLPEDEA